MEFPVVLAVSFLASDGSARPQPVPAGFRPLEPREKNIPFPRDWIPFPSLFKIASSLVSLGRFAPLPPLSFSPRIPLNSFNSFPSSLSTTSQSLNITLTFLYAKYSLDLTVTHVAVSVLQRYIRYPSSAFDKTKPRDPISRPKERDS